MVAESKLFLCPACGYNLGFESWNGDSASDEICPSCGIHFGYDDVPAAGGREGSKQEIYQNWRNEWMKKGMVWWSKGQPQPSGWDPVEQLQALGIKVGSPE